MTTSCGSAILVPPSDLSGLLRRQGIERLSIMKDIAEITRGPGLRWALGVFALVAVAIGFYVLLKFLAPDGAGFIDRMRASIEMLRGTPWRVPLVLTAYAVGGVIAFPILVLIGATMVALGPKLGFACALLGTLLAASLGFGIGRLAGRGFVRRWLGSRAEPLERRLAGRGVVTVALLRKVPIAPFTVVNMVIGSSGMPYREFIAGTTLGMLPFIAAFALVGGRIADMLRHPSLPNVALLVAAAALWIGVVLVLQWLVNRLAKSA